MKINIRASVILLTTVFYVLQLNSQNIGIGETAPDYRLHIKSASSSLLKIENSTTLAANVGADLFFKTGYWYTGAVKTIGTGANVARLGFFTYAGTNAGDLLERMSILDDGSVGIGTSTPDYLLHLNYAGSELLKLENNIALASSITADQFFKTGTYYTGAIKTIGTGSNSARLGLFTFASSTASNLTERFSILNNGYVGIGTLTPGFILDVNGRMRIKYVGATPPGVWFANAANNNDVGLVGMYSDDYIGLYGDNGAGWNMVMNTTNGRVGIGTVNPFDPLHVVGSLTSAAGRFVNNYVNSASGVFGEALVSTNGTGVTGSGSTTGLKGYSDSAESGDKYGLFSWAVNGTGSNFGAHCEGTGGTTAYGIYAKASGGTTNWAGYFVGNVYTTGSYLPSDRKLKNEIQPLTNSLDIIGQLKPSFYTYKTDEYKQMQLPEGIQYGLIADEVMEVIPGAVKKTVQPAQYEIQADPDSRKISDELEFNAVNYMQMVPILIGAVQEQQHVITDQQKKIEELEARLVVLEKN